MFKSEFQHRSYWWPEHKHQAISILGADKIRIVLDQFHTEILHLWGKSRQWNYILEQNTLSVKLVVQLV